MSRDVSIIINLYDITRHLRRFTEVCIWAIYQYTDPKDYELIIIDNKPKFEMNLHFGLDEKFTKQLKETHIVNKKDRGFYASMNQGAKLAKGKHLAFIENDVIITEGWLPKLRWYLENGYCDAVIPDQWPRTREFRKKTYEQDLKDSFVDGILDQNMIMVKREAFDKVGGWDDRFWIEYGWKAFLVRMQRSNFKVASTHAVPIHHVFESTHSAVTELEPERSNKQRGKDARLLNKEY